MFSNIMRDRKKKLMGLTVTSSLKLQNELTQKEPKKNLGGSKARKNKDIKIRYLYWLLQGKIAIRY